MRRLLEKINLVFWNGLTAAMPLPLLRHCAARLVRRDPAELIEVLGPQLNRRPNLDNMPFDLPMNGGPTFEHLSGLFASTSLDHGVIAMTVRQTAYLYGLVKQMEARKVIEIGRYKGGSTLVIASAMAAKGTLWSIDLGEKEARLHGSNGQRPFDEQLKDLLQRLGLTASLLTGDSRTIEVETGEVDMVFIDGDHSYEGVKNDFERFGRRVRVGGAVLFDDAFGDALTRTHEDSVGRLINEIISGKESEFRLAKKVNRLAHLERVKPASGAPAGSRSNGFRETTVQTPPRTVETGGVCVWFTGLSGAGKTTIANAFARQLSERGYL